ncbi:hypothetical protein B0J11DRAFT_586961 [Dendryphion nanum]|uniref:Uncharacterized protein n=1 Tax=Dendryphion nanum TaxID=256645 RepID=A0A9P9EI97_9PLEO|nr:hypothetical protein B0J11DRAFT_586961 [Dendryphion nanum]
MANQSWYNPQAAYWTPGCFQPTGQQPNSQWASGEGAYDQPLPRKDLGEEEYCRKRRARAKSLEIPFGSNLTRWDYKKIPIMFCNKVFDPDSLGSYIVGGTYKLFGVYPEQIKLIKQFAAALPLLFLGSARLDRLFPDKRRDAIYNGSLLPEAESDMLLDHKDGADRLKKIVFTFLDNGKHYIIREMNRTKNDQKPVTVEEHGDWFLASLMFGNDGKGLEIET